MTVAITAGLLMAGAIYLFAQREMLRVILGFVLLSHAANLVLLSAGGTHRRGLPFGRPEDTTSIADPLPQAFVLTAIVIAFAITIFMLVLAVTGRRDGDMTEGPSSATPQTPWTQQGNPPPDGRSGIHLTAGEQELNQ